MTPLDPINLSDQWSLLPDLLNMLSPFVAALAITYLGVSMLRFTLTLAKREFSIGESSELMKLEAKLKRDGTFNEDEFHDQYEKPKHQIIERTLVGIGDDGEMIFENTDTTQQ